MSLEVYEYLSAHRPFFLASVQGDSPRLRPMGFLMWHEGKIWLGMGDHKEVYKQIAANPNVQVVAVDPGASWLMVTAKLVFDPSPELFAKAMEAAPNLKEIYFEGGPRMAVGSLSDGTAEFMGATQGVVKTVKI